MSVTVVDRRVINRTVASLARAATGGRVVDYLPDKAEPPLVVIGGASIDYDERPNPVVDLTLILLASASAGTERAWDVLSAMECVLVPALDGATGTGICGMTVAGSAELTREEVAALGYWGGRIDLRIYAGS